MTEFLHSRSMQNFIDMNGETEGITDSRLTEQALQQSEDRALLAIAAARMGTCDWNIVTGKIVWNEYHVLMLGYVPGDVEYGYDDWERRVHPEDLARVNAALDRAMTDRTDYTAEYRIIWADGSLHWIQGFGRFYYDGDGRAIRMTGLAIDITDRKQVELDLKESQERMTLALDAARMGTYDWDLVKNKATWNKYHAILLDYPPDLAEYTYEDWQRRVYPPDLPRVEAALQLAMDTHTEYSCEYRVVWQDGSIHWIHRFGRFYYDRTGQANRTIGVANDITDRKQAELLIQESEERMSLAIDAARMGAFDWDLTTDKIIWNGYHAELLGYSSGSGEYSYGDWERTVHPADLLRVQQAIELAKLDRTDYSAEYRVVWADGTIRWLAGFGRFYYTPDDRASRMTGVIYDITNRVRSEIANKESEALFRTTFELAAVGFAHVALDGQWLLVNQKLCEIVGYSKTELFERTFQNITHPDDLSTDLEYLRQLIAGEIQTYTMEKRYIQKLGTIVWVNLTVSLQRDASGVPLHFISAIEDISDRKQDEADLRRSEEFNRRILENNKDCIKVLDLEGRLLYMNDGGQKLMEIDEFAQVDRALWMEFWGGTERETATLAWEDAKAGKVSKFEGRCPTATGKPKWWQVTVAPMFDELGNVEQILSISHDITDRIESELAIRESEDRFRSTFEQAAVGVAHVDLQGRWMLVNQKICEIVGYGAAELIDRNFEDITHPDDLAQDREKIRQIMAGEVQAFVLEKRYLHKLGHIVWINLTATLRRNESGEPLYFIASFEDITARKESEFALHAQTIKLAKTTALAELRNQELDRFAHIVSHDLKAPLRGIANLAEWIEDDLMGEVDPDVQKNLELMRSRVYRMEGLINGLLAYARVGNTQASLETFSVEDLLSEIVDSLSVPDRFAIELPTALPPITTNRVLLSQVFANLIGNAWKHHDRSAGTIRVTAQPQGELWEFAVTDDGAGIAPENQQRVFEIFQTLTSPSPDSTGIGLSIVKKIVESHGGKISVECPLERGTTFRFTWQTGGSNA